MAKKDQEELDEPTLEDLEEEEDTEDIEPPSEEEENCLLYTSPSPRDSGQSRMPSSA